MFERLLMKIRGKNSDADLRWCIDHGFRHGDNFNCFTPDAIDSNYPWLITVGDNVTISSDVKILAHDASTLLTKSHTKVGIVNIGDNVFIGAGTIVLCNTRIGDNVVIGANSVVTHNLAANGVYAGNPAKFICSFDDYKAKHERALKTHRYFTELRVLHQLQDFRPSGKGGLRYGRCSDISFHAVRFLGRQRHAAALRHAR